jgi:hypothetical protein
LLLIERFLQALPRPDRGLFDPDCNGPNRVPAQRCSAMLTALVATA